MSSKIKHEKFSGLHRLDLKDLFLTSSSAVTGTQKGAVERSGTAGHLYPGLPTGLQAKSRLLFRRETSRPNVDILMHRHGTIASLFRSDESPSPAIFIERDRLLFITGHQTCLAGNNPDLQEVHQLGLRCVVFAVADSCSGAHALYIANSDDGARARAVFVRQGSL